MKTYGNSTDNTLLTGERRILVRVLDSHFYVDSVPLGASYDVRSDTCIESRTGSLRIVVRTAANAWKKIYDELIIAMS